MAPLQKFTLEFPINASPKVLFTLIGTAEGLSRWFADKVTIRDDMYIFDWEGTEQKACLAESKEMEYVYFRWADDYHKGYNMELKITHEPVSGGTSLIISDYAELPDLDVSQMWWTTQVTRLQRMFSN
jgi:uncharacterized protein YndB with AHSA1/START domain